jgi:hypothetical protein
METAVNDMDRKQYGSGKGVGQPSGQRKNKNLKPCKDKKSGQGKGKGLKR